MENIMMALQTRINNHQFASKEELQIVIRNLRENNQISEEIAKELLDLYDKTNNIKDVPKFGIETNYENVLIDLEKKINNNEFASKEELTNYINKIKANGIPESILTPEKITEYLNLYDTLNPELDPSLDLQNYQGVKLENTNVIVGIEQDKVLKTDRSNSEMPQEFKENQNELTALSDDSLANANETFEHMREHKKEELDLIPLNEAINKENVDVETLNKIRFFITNKYINPHSYKVDLENVIFYDIETNEVLEVRKNETTEEYEIYRGGEKVYDDSSPENELQTDTNEEQMAYENKDAKVRRLIKPIDSSSAFVQSSLLFIICIVLGLILSVIILIK